MASRIDDEMSHMIGHKTDAGSGARSNVLTLKTTAKKYIIEDNQIILHSDGPICSSKQELLQSDGFRQLVSMYVRSLDEHESPLLDLLGIDLRQEGHQGRLIDIMVKLADGPVPQEVARGLLGGIDREKLHDWINGLYDFWRSYDRFVVLHSEPGPTSLDQRPYRVFNLTIESLTHMIRSLYRDVCENITGDHPRIYRQVAAGCNAGLIAVPKPHAIPNACREAVSAVPFIRQIWIDPPMIIDPPTNKRSGAFRQVHANPLSGVSLSSDEWLCYPAQVGPLVVFTYFHRSFMGLGCALANLFELADDEQIERGPDALFAFGLPAAHLAKFGHFPTVFYDDEAQGLLVGAVPDDACFGYFGYLKKMMLTLHNIAMMKRGRMPFHGAMVRLVFRHSEPANILIIGDTGTGKSECLEALRKSGADRIRDMQIIADDMGSIDVSPDGSLLGYGTETGAFIRLDDLDAGFAFGQIDRSIIMSPQKTNARCVIPVTTLEHVLKGYKVHFLLYANNHQQVEPGRDDGPGAPVIERFRTIEEALAVFSEGAAMSKGTTTSTGLTRTYFANSFGPLQYKKLHQSLAEKTFQAAFRSGIFVGQLRTRLGISGCEKIGPETAADALLDLITREQTGASVETSPGVAKGGGSVSCVPS